MKKISSVHNTNLRKEIKIHQSLRHPNIIRFEGAVQVEHMVYIMLEYADNGALFFFINPRTGMPEKFAFKFFYQTALALEYLHSKGIMHRDIKPENILLDRNYDAKLCDFGWCTEHGAHLPDDESICGTYEYMPPEIVYEKSHNKEVDIWAIGVLLYELIHGRAPYTAESLDDIKERMKQTEITFKKSLSAEAKDLLLKLLKFEPSERIKLEQIFTHPFILKHLDEYENNKDSFKYIPPEPEWDNDLDIYLNGEMTSAADEAKAALSAYDDRHRFEEELLNDPVKQQAYIKKQFEENKINSSDVEKVFFLRDESGNLKMRLQMKDRPQPMRGNSEKKNSLARARGSEKFQRIVGPNSPPKTIEEANVKSGLAEAKVNNIGSDHKGPAGGPVQNPNGGFVSSIAGAPSEYHAKRKDPLSVQNPQSFQALHATSFAAEAQKLPTPAKNQEELGLVSAATRPRVPSELEPTNHARNELSVLKSQQDPTNLPKDNQSNPSASPSMSPIKSPLQPTQQGPILSPSTHSAQAVGLATSVSKTDHQTILDQPPTQLIRIVSSSSTSGLPPIQMTPQQAAQSSGQQPKELTATQAPSQSSPSKQQAPTQPQAAPSKVIDNSEQRKALQPLDANADPLAKGPSVPTTSYPTKVPSLQPSAHNLQQQSHPGQTLTPMNNSQSATGVQSIPSKQAFAYDQLSYKAPTSILPSNPYNPAVTTQDASRKETSSTIQANQTTTQQPQLERGPPSPVLQHNRSTGNYAPTLKLLPQAEAPKQTLEEPSPSATKKPSAQSDLATLLGQKPNSWAKIEHGQPIYPPNYDPKNKSPQQTSAAFNYPGAKPPGQTPDSSSPVKMTFANDLAKAQSNLSQNKIAAQQVTLGPTSSATRGPETAQASSSAYRPLTRSVSRKEHTSNYTPPTSIPRLPTESNQSSLKTYEVNPLKQKFLSKPGQDVFLPSPESGNLKRNLISMGDRRLGMKIDETAHSNNRKEEFNNTFSHSSTMRTNTENKEPRSDEKLKTLSGASTLQGVITTFRPTGNHTLVQGSQSRYGLAESSKKPPILSQKTPMSLQTSKPDIRSALQEPAQHKGPHGVKVFNSSGINSPREIMRNGASINQVINQNDLTAMQSDTSPAKKTNAQAITSLLTENNSKGFEQSQPNDTKTAAGAIVIRSTAATQQESLARNLPTAPALSSQTLSNQTQIQRDRGFGHFESSATSLTHGMGTWSQSRPHLDQSGATKTLPSSTDIGRINDGSFVDRQPSLNQTTDYSGQRAGGVIINSRKNSSTDNELGNKLRDMHGNELRHNTQSPLVFKQETTAKPAEVQTFGIYEGRTMLERSKSQSNPRRDILNNQLGTISLKQTVIDSTAFSSTIPERKSQTGFGEFRQVAGNLSSNPGVKGFGNPQLSSLPRSIQNSVKDFALLKGGTESAELNRSMGESGTKTTMRYSQTYKYQRYEQSGPISLEHKTLAEASTHNLGEKNLVSIYNPTSRYIASNTKEETSIPTASSKPNENLAQQLGLKYDYSGFGPQKMESYGLTSSNTRVIEKKHVDDLTSSPSSWNRASLPGKADIQSNLSQGHSPSQALNMSSPLMNTKDYEGLKSGSSGYTPMKPATSANVISSTSNNLVGIQSQGSSGATPISIVGRTSSSSAGFGPIAATSSTFPTSTLSSNQGPISIQSGTYKPQLTIPAAETRQLTVVYSGTSTLGKQTSTNATTTIYSKPRELFGSHADKLVAN